MAAPNLSDPMERATYLAELKQVARGTRTSGIALAMLGCALALVRALWLPQLPALVPLVLIVTALGLMLVGTVRRTRWHLSRMRG